jgi:hypothetical protein
MIINNQCREPSYTRNIEEIQKQLPLDTPELMQLVEIDRGEPGANMTTKGLVAVLKNTESYIFEKGVFKQSQELYPIDLEERATSPLYVQVPDYLEVEAVWDKTPQKDCENVFGDTVRLFVNHESLTIPVVRATAEKLAYYGAATIPEGEAVRFPGDEFPIFFMEFGDDWLKEGVQTESFGGVFLEYHSDQPHFHMAYDKGSLLTLAKWVDLTPDCALISSDSFLEGLDMN